MIVRFAEICDHCGKRSEEYSRWFTCRECGDDVCADCSRDTDEESGRATCNKCAPAMEIVRDIQGVPAWQR